MVDDEQEEVRLQSNEEFNVNIQVSVENVVHSIKEPRHTICLVCARARPSIDQIDRLHGRQTLVRWHLSYRATGREERLPLR